MREIFKTSAKSNPNSLAGAITSVIKKGDSVEIQAVGAAAVNQTMKAVAIARGFLAPTGHDITCSPAFSEVIIGSEIKTAMKLFIDERVS